MPVPPEYASAHLTETAKSAFMLRMWTVCIVICPAFLCGNALVASAGIQKAVAPACDHPSRSDIAAGGGLPRRNPEDTLYREVELSFRGSLHSLDTFFAWSFNENSCAAGAVCLRYEIENTSTSEIPELFWAPLLQHLRVSFWSRPKARSNFSDSNCL